MGRYCGGAGWSVDPGGEPTMLDTDFADRCNNDHGFPPDGSLLAISHDTDDKGSHIYTVPGETVSMTSLPSPLKVEMKHVSPMLPGWMTVLNMLPP